jgi:hypothetical protein
MLHHALRNFLMHAKDIGCMQKNWMDVKATDHKLVSRKSNKSKACINAKPAP